MSTISGVSSAGDAWASMKAQRSQMQAKMFTKVDTDSSGGVDKTELQGLLDDVAKKTGVTNSSSTGELFSKMDSNSDGSLSSDELSQGMQSIMPPPHCTMDFAKGRSDSNTSDASGDDLFGKVDTDGNGSVSREEMQSLMTLMDKLASDSGSDSASSSSSSDVFSKLDANSDASLSKAEFEAGRPQAGNGTQSASGMPPPPPPGGAGSSSASSTTYDPLDTNEDGVVSAQERLAGSTSTDPLQALLKSIDTNSDSKISSSESGAFIEQLTSQIKAMTQSTENTVTSASTSSQAKPDSFDLAQLARRAYDQIASGLTLQARGSTLSAMA